jgi:hypothetical protein
VKTLLFAVFVAVFTGCSNSGLPGGSNELRFSSDIWKDESSVQSLDTEELISTREMMLEDLLVNVLPGKTAAEIEALLGPSVDTEYFSSMDKDFIYYMGPERSSFMAIDSEWLLIWVGEDGRFARYSIVND